MAELLALHMANLSTHSLCELLLCLASLLNLARLFENQIFEREKNKKTTEQRKY